MTTEGGAVRLSYPVAGDHKRLVLDRTGAQQRAPVGQAGVGPLGGNEKSVRAFQGVAPKQFRKAQVVTDRQPEKPPRRFGQGGARARGQPPVLVHQPEKVEFAVLGYQVAFCVEKSRRIGGPTVDVAQQRPVHEEPVSGGQAGHFGEQPAVQASSVALGMF